MRFGVLGTGFWASDVHAASLAGHPGHGPVVDPDPPCLQGAQLLVGQRPEQGGEHGHDRDRPPLERVHLPARIPVDGGVGALAGSDAENDQQRDGPHRAQSITGRG